MKLVKTLAPLLVLAASFAGYYLLDMAKPEPERETAEPRPTGVYTLTAQQTPEIIQVVTSGEVRARTTIDLISQVNGRVVEVSPEFTAGGKLAPNDVLLKIEDIDYRLAVSRAEADVAAAKVQVQQALADADVARRQLRNDKTATALALKQPQVDEARARLRAAQAGLEQTRVDLQRTSIALPFAGRLISTRVHTGQFISAGTVLGRAFATDLVELRLPLNDAQLAALGLPIGFIAEPGAGLPVTLQAAVGGARHQWQGELLRLDAAIDSDTRMLYGTVEVRDPYGEGQSPTGMPLAVGLYAEATINGRELSQAVSLPRNALRAGNVVFVINDDNRLEVREVNVAHSSPRRAIITAGVNSGDKIVTSVVRNPVAGMALMAIDESPAATASTAEGEQEPDVEQPWKS